MYDVHYWPTPNGKKVTVLLEELGAPYTVVPVNIGRGDQFSADFLRMNPNHRMPVLVDNTPMPVLVDAVPRGSGAPQDAGSPISIFESGAIMQYLAEKHGRFMPIDPRGRAEVMQWVFWQMANQGPKLGECGHFRRLDASKGDQSYAVRRFTDEANRLYGVLNNRLHDRRYLAGDEYSIADMICFPWTVNWKGQGQDIAEFPYFARWHAEVAARPAVQRGMAVGTGLADDPNTLSQEEKDRRAALMYNQRARPAPDGGLLLIPPG